jgi:hypothetical protein
VSSAVFLICLGFRFSVGPCALDYSKLKTADHWITDPPADELVQRHRMSSNCFGSSSAHSSAPSTPPTNRKLGLQVSVGVEQFHSQLKLGFEIVTGTLALTSK